MRPKARHFILGLSPHTATVRLAQTLGVEYYERRAHQVAIKRNLVLKFSINWRTDSTFETAVLLEGKLLTDLQSGHIDLKPCHTKPTDITLYYTDPFGSKFGGLAKCSCGVELAFITGNADGSKISFSSIKK